jgi:hypothetical protein
MERNAMRELFETLGMTGMALASLVYIGKLIITHIFSRDIDAHKAKLDHEMKGHAHQLDCLLQQFQIQFSKTYERQTEVTRQLYDYCRQLLARLDHVAFLIQMEDIFRNPNPPEVHKAIHAAGKVHGDLARFQDENDIYLPAALSKKLAAFLDLTTKPSITATLFPEHFTEKMVDDYEQLWTETKPMVEQLLTDLKTEFRRLQGIDIFGQLGV